mmetsp:Transcript_12624/g.33662  ORF Transcript_12624/g.33662 Transcript_12624/m.33662 type:complete len:204 (+) Transcript_12624:387-998(+)
MAKGCAPRARMRQTSKRTGLTTPLDRTDVHVFSGGGGGTANASWASRTPPPGSDERSMRARKTSQPLSAPRPSCFRYGPWHSRAHSWRLLWRTRSRRRGAARDARPHGRRGVLQAGPRADPRLRPDPRLRLHGLLLRPVGLGKLVQDGVPFAAEEGVFGLVTAPAFGRAVQRPSRELRMEALERLLEDDERPRPVKVRLHLFR